MVRGGNEVANRRGVRVTSRYEVLRGGREGVRERGNPKSLKENTSIFSKVYL